jgi:cytochrome c oxidase subunit 4
VDAVETPGVQETERQTEPAATEFEPELAHHPGPAEYVKVAVVLAVATGFEVGLYYVNMPHGLFVALLAFFAGLKFVLVVLWFMHLRFDSQLFKRLFVTGFILALMVYTIVLSAFGVFRLWFLLALVAGLSVLGVLLLVYRGARASRASAAGSGSTPASGGAPPSPGAHG